ncbi:MAG TPA: hypothetical protein DCL44_02005 [Elusimicrobia bacterium]|nr:hypothetical protein [Elusimicrobiota bacterium]
MICLTQNCTLFWYMPANSVQVLNAITAFVAYFHDETLNKNNFFSAPYLSNHFYRTSCSRKLLQFSG